MKGKGEKIVRALGIQTGDIIRTGYGQKVYEVSHISGPTYTHVHPAYLIILDHPEISLALREHGQDVRGNNYYLINDIRQVGTRWFTASNDELFIERPHRAPVQPTTLLDLLDPEDAVEELPTPAPYILNPSVNYHAGPRRVWRCTDCDTDFNTEQPTYLCWHDCGTNQRAVEIFYVQAPHPNDRRMFTSYALMTLNHSRYEAVSYQAEVKAA